MDLLMEQEISLEESLTGGKLTIEHLNEKQVTLQLRPGRILKPNNVLVVDNLGMPDMQGGYGKL
jgi:DnaJ family protein A protein 2